MKEWITPRRVPCTRAASRATRSACRAPSGFLGGTRVVGGACTDARARTPRRPPRLAAIVVVIVVPIVVPIVAIVCLVVALSGKTVEDDVESRVTGTDDV